MMVGSSQGMMMAGATASIARRSERIGINGR